MNLNLNINLTSPYLIIVGQFAPSCLTVSGQYSDLVWKSIPLAWPTADSTDSDSVTPTVARKENNHKRHSSFKRQSPTFTPGSVEVDIALAEYLNNSVGTPSRTSSGTLNLQQSEEKKSLDLACIKNNLDNLFYLAEGSTEFDKQLRYCFYKVLNIYRNITLYLRIYSFNETFPCACCVDDT